MAKKSLVFVTSNDHKAGEAAQVLGMDVERVKLNLDEIQSLDLRAIVEHKVRQAYAKLKRPVIAEDVSLAIRQLNGLPGTFIKWFENGIGSQGVADMLSKKDRSVDYIVGYGFFDGKTFIYADAVTKGTISKKVKGTSGFGFDTIFIPRGYAKTFAELGMEVKMKIGSRPRALKKLKKFLASYGS
jgi:non-canonical purine NTP pyrophosphatase (RdgB/HAM1 family)